MELTCRFQRRRCCTSRNCKTPVRHPSSPVRLICSHRGWFLFWFCWSPLEILWHPSSRELRLLIQAWKTAKSSCVWWLRRLMCSSWCCWKRRRIFSMLFDQQATPQRTSSSFDVTVAALLQFLENSCAKASIPVDYVWRLLRRFSLRVVRHRNPPVPRSLRGLVSIGGRSTFQSLFSFLAGPPHYPIARSHLHHLWSIQKLVWNESSTSKMNKREKLFQNTINIKKRAK